MRARDFTSSGSSSTAIVSRTWRIWFERVCEFRRRDTTSRWDTSACRSTVAELYKATPIILVPAAPGPAPLGLASTGDSRMNAPWTALGTPAITVPMPVGSALPLGLQLTADRGQDASVLRTAVRLETLLRQQ